MLDDFLCERQSDEMYNEIMAYEAELEYEEEERRQAFEARDRSFPSYRFPSFQHLP